MSKRERITVDGNEAAASVAYRLSEVIAIYPITPASPMGEHCDQWAMEKRANVWGNVPDVSELQSEAGAAGAVHGALQAGSLSTSFTASQGLLLMIPNLYKIAGELTPFVLHVAARTIATHALSIFGDHSDVMACRQTGFGMLASSSVQEAQDLACIAHSATLAARVPLLHFFDGFRTSHELAKIASLSDEDLLAMVDGDDVLAHRARALSPDHPVIRGTAQNPDVFFQAREAANPFHLALPGIVQEHMDRFAALTGRRYRLFDYFGHPEAERVIVLMGSGAETARETAAWMVGHGEKVGVLQVRLYRPFDAAAFLGALPRTTERIAVLDRTKEPGSVGEPLFLDVATALRNAEAGGESPLSSVPLVVGGRYGLSSKEFDPGMVRGVFRELAREKPRNGFTVGIVDDVLHTSLEFDPLDVEGDGVYRAIFYGLGSDGTVSANKNTIKIVGGATDRHVQGYFVYDSKKAGATTVSHLRISPREIHAPYLVAEADFVGCHQEQFVDSLDVLAHAKQGASFLLNTAHAPEDVWRHLPVEVQRAILEKHLSLWVIDAYRVASEAELGGRINTIMQVAFFAISGLLERDRAVAEVKHALEETYGKRGLETVRRNFAAVDSALDALHRVEVPAEVAGSRRRPPVVAADAPEFVQRVTAVMMAGHGDLLPVSAFPVDGTWPLSTSRWEKRNIARTIPIWDPDVCIQCNLCSFVCPHAAIRTKAYAPAALGAAPESFLSSECRTSGFQDRRYTVQVAPEDCTGCSLCVTVCPAKDKTNPRHKAIDMESQAEHLALERERYAFFLDLPETRLDELEKIDAKTSQLLQPLFEYSGACAGCGETPYVKLLTQLFGDRALIANATGCSSIYGGNLPTTPYATNAEGRGPAWSNSLFEDNAEFGYGFRLSLDQHARSARRLLREMAPAIGGALYEEILRSIDDPERILDLRKDIARLKEVLHGVEGDLARRLEVAADHLVAKSVWIVGGDGWAYDIGYGGLDHVLAAHRNVNVLVLDTEVYSNTGGQQSKATPLGAAAKFASAGKDVAKKDLGLEAMSYGHVYVARVAFGAKPNQTVQAFLEAASYDGPSLILAYSPCIAHGYDLSHNVDQQKLAVQTGAWNLCRYDPRRIALGEKPLQLDAPAPRKPLGEFMRNEARFRMVERANPERFRRLAAEAQEQASRRWSLYEQLSHLSVPAPQAAAAVSTDGNGSQGGEA